MKDIQDFNSIKIKIASPELIESWSYGEVTKPETINYRTLKPEKDGLFCEKIFGTTKEWECYCGKFKSIRYKGVICERCGVEVTSSKVRRKRTGHIILATPVSHVWFYKSIPSRIAQVLGIDKNSLSSVIFYEKYIVLSPGDTDLKKGQVLSEQEYNELNARFQDSTFRAEMGSEAIRELLSEINLDDLSKSLRDELQRNKKNLKNNSTTRQKLLERLEVVENLKNGENRPEWMVLTVIPVIPPDLRPMVQLEGGRFATSDLNDLYRRVINRNNRLKKLLDLHSPDTIIRNEKRMLQEAVDFLLDSNSSKGRVVKGAGSKALKSLGDMLKGKTGRFRENLLGKRTDFSGRSVIVIGPELKLHQCGLPSVMAIELFKPFLMKKLMANGIVATEKMAKTMIDGRNPQVWDLLEEVVREHPVLLNRAPTLHRLGIQAFEPVIIDGKAIKLHPLVCHGVNADFDGDQMSVHVPLTQPAIIECWMIMLSARNLLDPANGKPIVFPSQDMVLGINYLTKAEPDKEAEKAKSDENYIPCYPYYDNVAEIYNAIDNNAVAYHQNILYKIPETNERIITTPGRVIFNDMLPDGIDFYNKCFGDSELKALIADTLKNKSNLLTVKLLDAIKYCGFKYATLFGATIGLSDMLIPKEKKEIIEEASKRETEILNQFKRGMLSNEERTNKIVDLWTKANDELAEKLMSNLGKDKDGFNSMFMMADSGARGSKNQIRQLCGMRGLMSKPSGEIIEFPIKSNFKEGLSIIEFFISTNGARKGLADTALKTSRAGHLTRRLVDVSQDVVITQEDCGTINGIYKTALKEGDEIIESLSQRIKGSFSLEDIKNPATGEIIVHLNEEITDEKAQEIEDSGIEKVFIRSVLTCETKRGLCRKCYGRNLANNSPVNIGEAVGIIAAQSIGQPGTQLTMRTFHAGGTASASTEDNAISFSHDVLITHVQGTIITAKNEDTKKQLFARKGYIYYKKIVQIVSAKSYEVEEKNSVVKGMVLSKSAKENIVAQGNGSAHFIGKNLYVLQSEQRIEIKAGSELLIKSTDDYVLKAGEQLVSFDPFTEPIVSEADGIARYKDIHSGTTLIEEYNEASGNVIKRISSKIYQNTEPSLVITDKKGNVIQNYLLPSGSTLEVDDGQQVKIGDVLAKIAKESVKTMDITGGLPRIEELVEGRIPSNPAILAHVEGIVRFEGIERKQRVVYVDDPFGKSFKHLIPLSKHILVRDGDRVEAAEPLCDGAIDPHNILEIKGENALQEYLVDQMREVYRSTGVDIHEKHCGIIVRQMLRKVRIVKVGDTNFVQNQKVDKQNFNTENARVEREGGVPAVAAPLLQGITKSTLLNSFIASASFQETTKVLTNAAIKGSIDWLAGLKENVVIGHRIPAGTGMKYYTDGIELVSNDMDSSSLDERIKSVRDEFIDDLEEEQEIVLGQEDNEILSSEFSEFALDDDFSDDE